MQRWFWFNGVGVLGLAVQLGLLALLVRGLGLHYLPATALAVEAAVLHNFVWHQCWTWRDRPSAGPRDLWGRLARFHFLNGAVSLTGNLAIMAGLTGMLGLDAVAANVVAVLMCSFANFVAGNVLVFRTAVALLPVFVLSGGAMAATRTDEPEAELRPRTVEAWRQYEQRVDARYERLSAGANPFFAHDRFQQPARWRQLVRDGDVVMFQADTPDPGEPAPAVPDGKVHHWVGAIFIPGATVDGVLHYLREHAGREAESYEDVLASRLLKADGDRLHVFMKLHRESAFVSATYNTEHEVVYRRLDRMRVTSRSVATRIVELADAGSPREREKPVGSDRGFLWRLNAYWRYEQLQDGVLIECESVSLSRGVPLVLRPLITGMVEGIARDALQRTLRTLRIVLMRTR